MTDPHDREEHHDADVPIETVEVEQTYDVTDAIAIPDWTALTDVVRVDGPHRRSLDAHYIDTVDADLANQGVAIRRRTGGPDAGWHLKGPMVDDARVELHWPLGEEGVIPAAILDAAAEWASGELAPLARIRNERDAYFLRNQFDEVIAEFVDDHVIADDLRGGEQRVWREWEFELGPAAPSLLTARQELFDDAREVAYAQGATAAQSASKLARALGH